MKVAVVAPTYIPSRKANTLQVMKMTQAISAQGENATLIVPEDSHDLPGSDRSWDFLVTSYGLEKRFPMVWLPTTPGLRKYDYAWKALRWAEDWGAELVYTRLPQAAALAANRNMPTIYEVHDRPQGSLGPILMRIFLRGRSAKKLVAISKALARDLFEDYNLAPESSFLEVYPDGVDLERYKNLPPPVEARKSITMDFDTRGVESKFVLSPEQFTVGYTGHLYKGRGISLILEIAKRMPEISFLIVGGEPLDVGKLQQKVIQNNLQNVMVTGFVPNAELPAYQAACDVLLMPYQSQVSASSGGDIGRYLSPMKLFEYLASGRAICSSDLPVLREIISPELAMILPADEVDAWVAAIRKLVDDPALRETLGSSARSAANDYSWDARARRMLDEFQAV